MNKKYTLISISILTALYSQQSLADLHAQCLLGVPHFTGEVVKGDVNNLPVYIEADKAEINQPTQAIYQGNVDLKQETAIWLEIQLKLNKPVKVNKHNVGLIYVVDLIIKTIKSIY